MAHRASVHRSPQSRSAPSWIGSGAKDRCETPLPRLGGTSAFIVAIGELLGGCASMGKEAHKEPTSALDPELVGDVLRVMRGLPEGGRTMLVVTHKMAFARDVSSCVVLLHQGLVEEEGNLREMFAAFRTERFRQFISRN